MNYDRMSQEDKIKYLERELDGARRLCGVLLLKHGPTTITHIEFGQSMEISRVDADVMAASTFSAKVI